MISLTAEQQWNNYPEK